MLIPLLKLILLFGFTATCYASATNILITEIAKNANNQWTVSYKSKRPISSIQFAITADQSRHERWSLLNESFEFKSLAGRDTVFRRDGGTFNQVSFNLTPTYTHLPKNYAPFSPFSDGSMLFHSGRFFACPGLCSGQENLWYLKFNAPADETIILNGQQARGMVSWYDSNDGRKVYVGRLIPENFSGLLAIIDPALPSDIKTLLQQFLPKAFAHLSTKLQALTTQPMLYASFGATQQSQYGRQGGVLPDQIFMHWYGKFEHTEPYDLLWFYAHEAAHIFQHFDGMKIAPKDAWIHEGHADYVASLLLLNFYPEAKDYVEQRLASATKQCRLALNKLPLSKFSVNGEFKALYDCGLHFYRLLAKSTGNEEQIAFDFWKALGNQRGQHKLDTELIQHQLANLVGKDQLSNIKHAMGW